MRPSSRAGPQQRNGSPEKTCKAGENRVEEPGAFHGASDLESARLLAVFVVDTDEAELTRFVQES